ncbi:MAG: O-acetyl-ADP-ribose deacetylase [Candidatus Sumerlaeota bacterium]|nr:O-acetyl-ADP-ribose deacetylase [Candidatus Sumerlaeota bacterium]
MDVIVYRHPSHTARTISIVEGDITREDADVIVNAANRHLAGGGGVDGAIHRAGGPALLEECRKFIEEHGPLVRGEAMSTTGGRLKARHVIHTAGPVYRDGGSGEEEHLRGNYANSLRLAAELGAGSVAFPAISCGVYGYPFEEAAAIALEEMHAFLVGDEAPDAFAIRFVLFSGKQAREALRIAEEVLG